MPQVVLPVGYLMHGGTETLWGDWNLRFHLSEGSHTYMFNRLLDKSDLKYLWANPFWPSVVSLKYLVMINSPKFHPLVETGSKLCHGFLAEGTEIFVRWWDVCVCMCILACKLSITDKSTFSVNLVFGNVDSPYWVQETILFSAVIKGHLGSKSQNLKHNV